MVNSTYFFRFRIYYPDSQIDRLDWTQRYSMAQIYKGKSAAEREKDKKYFSLKVDEAVSKKKAPTIAETPVKVYFDFSDELDAVNHAYYASLILDAITGLLIKGTTKQYVTGVSLGFHTETQLGSHSKNYITVTVREDTTNEH